MWRRIPNRLNSDRTQDEAARGPGNVRHRCRPDGTPEGTRCFLFARAPATGVGGGAFARCFLSPWHGGDDIYSFL
jgi:hypothetical protein